MAAEAKETIETEAEVLISAASAWEIAIKQALLKLAGPPDLLDVVANCGLVELPIRSRHATEVGGRSSYEAVMRRTGCPVTAATNSKSRSSLSTIS